LASDCFTSCPSQLPFVTVLCIAFDIPLHRLPYLNALRTHPPFLFDILTKHTLSHRRVHGALSVSCSKLESINCSQLLTESHFAPLVSEIICRNRAPKVGLAFQSCSYDVPSSRRQTRPSRKSASNKRRTACLSQGGVLLCETNCLHAYRLQQ
jgi:hypothetical protein